MKCPLHVFNYSIQNASENEVDIFIDGEIVDASTQQILKDWFGDSTSTSFKSFRQAINDVDVPVYNVYVNSPGGMVTDAMAIHDFIVDLQNKGKTVNTKGRGIIASAATYILMAGRNSEMSKNSWLMIHNVSGMIWGDVNQVESYAGTLRKFNDAARDFYANATGQRKEDITKMMNAETWMTAEEAKAKGFVKNISGDASFKQSISKDHWQYSNTAVLNFYNAAVKQPQQSNTDDMKKLFEDFAAKIMNAIKNVKPAENNDQTALINSIAEAIKTPFEEMGGTMETAVNDSVTAAVKTAVENALNTDVKTAVDNAVKPLNDKITDLEKKNGELEKKNGELETEITNVKGKSSGGGKEEVPKQVGKFAGEKEAK